MPRPSSVTVIDEPSSCSVTLMLEAWPFIASSIALSTISQTRWCRPALPTPPMYMPGRLRTGSSPSRTVMSLAVYDMVVLELRARALLDGEGLGRRRRLDDDLGQAAALDHLATLAAALGDLVLGGVDALLA